MDLSFALRQRRRGEPQFAQLLALSSVAQATSPTARAHAALSTRSGPVDAIDMRIDLMNGAAHPVAGAPASFGRPIVSARQPE